MIVLDATIVVDLLLALPPHAETIAARIARSAPQLAAPHLLDAEVAQVLRRFVLSGELGPSAAREALDDLQSLPITRYPHAALLPRAFELRDNATIYDALYLVLAEALDAPLWTRDVALSQIPGAQAKVEVL